jgi:hypothetical protein
MTEYRIYELDFLLTTLIFLADIFNSAWPPSDSYCRIWTFAVVSIRLGGTCLILTAR